MQPSIVPSTLTASLIPSHPPSPPTRPIAPTPEAQPRPVNTTSQGCCSSGCHPVQVCNYSQLGLSVLMTVGGVVGGSLTTSTPILPYVLYSVAGIGAAGTLTTTCNAIYLKVWRPKKKLEETVDASIAEITTLKGRIQDLEHQKEIFSKLEHDLRIDLQIEQTEDASLTGVIDQIKVKIIELMARGTQLQTSLDNTLRLKDEWKAVAKQVSMGTTSFDTELSRLIPAEQRAETAIGSLQQLAQAADMDLERAQALATKMDEARQGWIKILQDLYREVSSFKTSLEEKTRQLEEQKSLITDLEATNSKLSSSTEALTPAIAQFQGLVQQYQQAQARFTLAQQKLVCLRDLPANADIAYIRNAAEEALRALQP